MDYQISLCASACRPEYWETFCNSLKGNTINIEVVFVGPNPPLTDLGPNFKFIKATCKPSQCYQIAFNNANGEIIGFTADDVVYDLLTEDGLDRVYNFYKKFNNYKNIIAQRPIEDGRDVWYQHYLMGNDRTTPIMAPLGFISNKFLKELGGYDINFISGQGENDLIMRAYGVGGRVERIWNSFANIFHRSTHELDTNAKFRKYGTFDRIILEERWILENKVSPIRLKPLELFKEREDWYFNGQGPKGIWD